MKQRGMSSALVHYFSYLNTTLGSLACSAKKSLQFQPLQYVRFIVLVLFSLFSTILFSPSFNRQGAINKNYTPSARNSFEGDRANHSTESFVLKRKLKVANAFIIRSWYNSVTLLSVKQAPRRGESNFHFTNFLHS